MTALKHNKRILNYMRYFHVFGSQCNWNNDGVMWLNFGCFKVSLAAAF